MRITKTLVVSLLSVIMLYPLTGCGQKLPPLDKSPADISILRNQDKQAVIRVVYGRPQKKDREVFGRLVPYGEVWRTGANEATEISFYQEVTMGGERIAPGSYALFSIPGESEWTIILNSQWDQWGAYGYDDSKNVTRFTVPVGVAPKEVEALTIVFKQDSEAPAMILAWDRTMVEIPISW